VLAIAQSTGARKLRKTSLRFTCEVTTAATTAVDWVQTRNTAVCQGTGMVAIRFEQVRYECCSTQIGNVSRNVLIDRSIDRIIEPILIAFIASVTTVERRRAPRAL
jgi:hypothetical protein